MPRFRTFASERNRQVFIEKWGKALEDHEPPMRRSPPAVKRAIARAEAFAEECRRKGPPAIAQLARRAAFDPIVQERRLYEASRVFQKAYVEHLTEALERAEAECERTVEPEGILQSRSALFKRLVTMLVYGKRAP